MKTFKLILMVLFFGLLANQVTYGQNTSREYFESATSKYDKGDYDGAIADSSRAIELDPRNAYAYRVRGNAKDDKGDYAGAVADYRDSIALDSQDFRIYFDWGIAAGRKSNYGTAIELSPNFIQAYVRRGAAKQAKGDTDGAAADSQKARELSAK